MDRGKTIRDPRKSGRGSRGAIRPRIQSQPGYESSSQPGYRPQMYPQSPPFFYTPQQPLPQIPPNFEPFEPQYTQQSPPQMPSNFNPRERVSEPLPVRDDTEDDEDFDHVDMEEALAKAWIKISVDREVSDRQTREGFWKRVLKHYKTLMPRTQRTKDQLNSKWTPMYAAIAAFNGYYTQAVRLKESGCDDLQVYERANQDFEKQFRKTFSHSKAWHILKDQAKWKAQKLVTEAAESTGSSKKRKSSESKAKKKANSEESSRSSMRDTLASYMAEKKSLMQAQLEVQKKKDAEYFKFIDGEVINRDMKFVIEPHDNIPDPAFKDFVINRKREICAQYGWPCSL
ncbi:myb-like domain, Myb/SANT-like DNA-binding domain protein [Artemisia annua]|uniref:Myb-like domain, Myb/SANT-like DNA-binding domain protein n=1 Tax=Artemisia annua TaxID=35608 RepID=A0A2U1L3C8_ARTAN|nr:myb-like domain, Myb/SANT-like DNA-binding domain protein [Artemisia annua]